ASCRAASGTCDVAETCNGTSTACPADGVRPAGFVCRAASGTCDVAETCNGSSTTCAADAFQPDGTSCTATGVCSAAGTCEAGICVGETDPDACADDHLCYKVKPTTAFAGVFNVHLVDEFESINVDVVKVKTLCTPANKNAEGVLDPVTHLETYATKAIDAPAFVHKTGVKVDNQLG